MIEKLLALLRSRVVVISALSGFAFLGAFTAVVFLFSLYLQYARGYSPLDAGLATLPLAITLVIIAPEETPVVRALSRVGNLARGFAHIFQPVPPDRGRAEQAKYGNQNRHAEFPRNRGRR